MNIDNKIATMLAVGVLAQSSREALSNAQMLDEAVAAGAIALDPDEVLKLRASATRYRVALAHLTTLLQRLVPWT